MDCVVFLGMLGNSTPAVLSVLAFNGATKRNKPSLAVGVLVFARVSTVDRHLEPELTCQVSGATSASDVSHFAKKDWVTGEGVYGELRGGTLVKASMLHARRYVRTPALSHLLVFLCEAVRHPLHLRRGAVFVGCLVLTTGSCRRPVHCSRASLRHSRSRSPSA